MACVHQNFLIDQAVDEELKKCFDEVLKRQMDHLRQIHQSLDEEMLRRVASRIVLEKKELYKILRKENAAISKRKEQELKKTETETVSEDKQKGGKSKKKKPNTLLQRSILNSYREKRKQSK